MANILSRLSKGNTITIDPGQNAIIIKKENFPSNIGAGDIDKFIEKNYPNLISRDESHVNGVTVTKDEIVITLTNFMSESQKDQIIALLQNRIW
jgi:hypothetical protein